MSLSAAIFAPEIPSIHIFDLSILGADAMSHKILYISNSSPQVALKVIMMLLLLPERLVNLETMRLNLREQMRLCASNIRSKRNSRLHDLS